MILKWNRRENLFRERKGVILSIQAVQNSTEKVLNICDGYYSNIQRDAIFTQFILSGNCSTCFGRYLHPSSGAQTTVSTASGICHSVTATCRYREKVGTGLSVLWVAYATHSTLKPVPTFSR